MNHQDRKDALSAVISALCVRVWRKDEFSVGYSRIGRYTAAGVWLRGKLLMCAPLVVFLTPVTEREGGREREGEREGEMDTSTPQPF